MKSESSTEQSILTRTQRARRDDIIAAAIVVINRDGYAAASIEKIAKEAGTSKSTVLYHFKSKEEINKVLGGNLFEDGAAYMGPFIVAAKTYTEKLYAYLSANLRYIAEHADHIAAVLQIEKDTSSNDLGDAPVIWLQKLLEDGRRAGEFGIFDTYIMALSIRLVIDNAPHYILSHPDIDIEYYIHEFISLFGKATAPIKKE